MPSTEKLFQDDAYLQECTAKVTAVFDQSVVLDRSVFYCQGGGQPGDTGEFVLSDGRTSEVIDTCLLYTSPSPRDLSTSRMPSSA